MKKAKLIGGICLVLVLVVSLTGCGPGLALADKPQDELPPGIEKTIQPVEAEIPYDGEVPLTPPSTRPVLLLSGSDYDMGYQYYQQIVQIFGPWVLELDQREFTEEQILALKANQWYISAETPEMIDFMKGMADGATDAGVELSYTEVLASFTGTRTRPDAPPGSEDDKLPPKDCSGFIAFGSATKDGELIFAGSGDHEMVYDEVILMFFPETGNNFVCSTHTGGCWHPGMNNKGLAYAHHGAGATGNYPRGYGIPSPFATLHTLRFADDAIEAVSEQFQLGYTCRAKGAWADTAGNAFVIECKDPVVVREPGDYSEEDFIYCTNNSLVVELEEFLNPKWGWDLYYVPHGGWWGYSETSVFRNLFIWNALHNYHGEVDLDFAKMMWRFPGEPPAYPTLEEAEAALYALQGEGWDAKICDQENAMVGIGIPDDGDEGLYYVSQGCAVRVAYPLGAGEHFYRIAPTCSFYELKLDSSPANVVDAARARAQFDLYDANLELGKLDYWDVPYAPLDEIFSQAATEWVKGRYYRGLAGKTTGNESIYNYAKALRAFTRCQAFAKQVYNALVPPATSPSDLGLGEWFSEEWGEWATIPHLEE